MTFRVVNRTTITPKIESNGNEITLYLEGTRLVYDATDVLIRSDHADQKITTSIAGCKYPYSIFYDPALRYHTIVGIIADYMARSQRCDTITITTAWDDYGAPEINVGAELDDVVPILTDAMCRLASVLSGAEIKKIGAKNDKNTEEVIENAEQ